jgi:hypothetical protein
MVEFIADRIWPRMRAAVKRQPGRCRIAVAYFGSGGAKRLPMTRGSTLVVDMSEHVVKSGQTNPAEIVTLLKKGVDVHSAPGLHAKVFVVGRQAFVGSTNASQNSESALIEAVVRSGDPLFVATCRDFVQSLAGERITLHQAKAMMKVYRAPRFPGKRARRKTDSSLRGVPQHSRLWLVSLKEGDWDDEDYAAEKAGQPAAKQRLKSTKWFKVDDFRWNGNDRLANELERGELVLQVTKTTRSRKVVEPVGRVIHLRRYSRRGHHRIMVFLETRKRLRKKPLHGVLALLGPSAKRLRRLDTAQECRNLGLSHSILNLWPNSI